MTFLPLVPTPRMSLPSLISSTVAADIAMSPGVRLKTLMMPVPSWMRFVCTAISARSVKTS